MSNPFAKRTVGLLRRTFSINDASSIHLLLSVVIAAAEISLIGEISKFADAADWAVQLV